MLDGVLFCYSLIIAPYFFVNNFAFPSIYITVHFLPVPLPPPFLLLRRGIYENLLIPTVSVNLIFSKSLTRLCEGLIYLFRFVGNDRRAYRSLGKHCEQLSIYDV